MTHANDLSDTIELELGQGRRDKITLLGPSLWGMIYRSEQSPACYRLMPMEDAPIEKRDTVRQWIKLPRKRAVAPIVETGQTFLNDMPFFFVRYEIAAEYTWANIIDNPKLDFSLRLEFAIRILREFSQWHTLIHQNPQQYLLPMPNDIVFIDTMPHLLAMPYWGTRNIEAILSVPQRGLYLPPEYVRGCGNKIWGDDTDIYALGMGIFQCLFTLTEIDNAERLLSKIANSSLLLPRYCKSRLPFWLEKVDICEELLADIRQIVHPDLRIRSSVDPLVLADRLETYLQQLKPEALLNTLISSRREEDALVLLQDILLEQNSYEHLLVAATIAGDLLGRTVEAIDFLERAIARDARNPAGYEAQLKYILNSLNQDVGAAGNQLESRMWRDFEAVPAEQKQKYEVDLAHYVLQQEQYQKAADFIYARLFEGEKYLWWKFDMTIAYAKTLMETGRYDDALAQMQDIKQNLKRVERNRSLSTPQVHLYGNQVSELEVELFNRRSSRR